jgi:flagellar biosynthetic protein FliR
MNLTIGNDTALAFGLLFTRVGGVMLALPRLLGVAIPVRVRVLLALLFAAALMPLATVAMPARDLLALAMLVLRELTLGILLSFAAAIAVGAVMTAGDLIGSGMELNTGGLLRANIVAPNILADGMGALAGMLFFVGGFHRALLLGLARSLTVAPLGTLELPDPGALVVLAGRLLVLALEIGLPVIVALFVLALAQGVIARLAPQVNILIAAPAAMILAGLMLLGLDALGLGAGVMRTWSSVMAQGLRWTNG